MIGGKERRREEGKEAPTRRKGGKEKPKAEHEGKDQTKKGAPAELAGIGRKGTTRTTKPPSPQDTQARAGPH